MERWLPSVELTKREQMVMKRLKRVRALFGFLRLHRHELFDAEFQDGLAEMSRDTGAGDEPIAVRVQIRPGRQLIVGLQLRKVQRSRLPRAASSNDILRHGRDAYRGGTESIDGLPS